MIETQVILKKGREKSVLNRHPWIFSGAIKRIEGNPENGDVVDVWNDKARFVCQGHHQLKITDPHSNFKLANGRRAGEQGIFGTTDWSGQSTVGRRLTKTPPPMPTAWFMPKLMGYLA